MASTSQVCFFSVSSIFPYIFLKSHSGEQTIIKYKQNTNFCDMIKHGPRKTTKDKTDVKKEGIN